MESTQRNHHTTTFWLCEVVPALGSSSCDSSSSEIHHRHAEEKRVIFSVYCLCISQSMKLFLHELGT